MSTNLVRRGIVEFGLARAGFVVTLATDAKEAFHTAERRHFDLVITDFRTPHGTGVDLVRQLRHLEQYDWTPMVLLAEEKAELDQGFLRDHLSVLVIREPYNIAEVVTRISRQFALPQASC